MSLYPASASLLSQDSLMPARPGGAFYSAWRCGSYQDWWSWVVAMRGMLTALCSHCYKVVRLNEALGMIQWLFFCAVLMWSWLQCPVSCKVLFGLGDFLSFSLSESSLSATSPEYDTCTNNTFTVTKGHKHVSNYKIHFQEGYWESVLKSAATVKPNRNVWTLTTNWCHY